MMNFAQFEWMKALILEKEKQKNPPTSNVG